MNKSQRAEEPESESVSCFAVNGLTGSALYALVGVSLGLPHDEELPGFFVGEEKFIGLRSLISRLMYVLD